MLWGVAFRCGGFRVWRIQGSHDSDIRRFSVLGPRSRTRNVKASRLWCIV